jgi:apolipoprotein N-acyltransferase
VCSAAGLIFPQLWWLALFGLGAFFSLFYRDRLSTSRALLYGLIFGLASGAAGTVWFWDTLPLTFLRIDNPSVQLIAVSMTWAYVALSLAAPVSVAALGLNYLGHSRCSPIVAAILWSATEVARMWTFALTTWAENSLFGPHFSAAAVGYALSENHALLQLAHPWGIDGLNFCASFAAALVAWLAPAIRSSSKRTVSYAQLLLVISVFILAEDARPVSAPGEAPRSSRFAVIHQNLTLESVFEKPAQDEVLQELSIAATASPPVDVILLPEELGLTSIFWSKEEYRSFVQRYFGGRDVLILNSRNDLFPAEERNKFPDAKKLLYDSTVSGELGRYIKQMLMPLGEYAPAFTKTFFSVINDTQLQGYLETVSGQGSRSDASLPVAKFKGVRIGGLLCSDLLSPKLYRSLVRTERPDILVNLANQFWFHGSKTLHWKTRQIARVHAVQNRLPLLIANNMAPSLIIDPLGRVVSESRWGARGVMYFDLKISAQD